VGPAGGYATLNSAAVAVPDATAQRLHLSDNAKMPRTTLR